MKEEDLKLKIGDIAKLCNVSNRSLRHYEKINLLVPSIVDEYSHYRYYGKEELMKLWFINRLKDQGFHLLEIKDLFDNGFYISDFHSVETHIRECKEEIELLQKRLSMLESLWSAYIKREGLADYYIDKLPAINVAYCRIKISNYDDLDKYVNNTFIPEIIRLGCQMPEVFNCFSVEIGQDLESDEIEIEFCDEVKTIGRDSELIKYKRLPEVPLAICMRVYGVQSKLPDACKYLCEEMITKRGYRVVGSPRFNYVVTFTRESDPEKWLTIIQVPVEKVPE